MKKSKTKSFIKVLVCLIAIAAAIVTAVCIANALNSDDGIKQGKLVLVDSYTYDNSHTEILELVTEA